MPPSNSIRDYLSSDERCLPLEATIDPGYVHKRRIHTMIGPVGMRIVDEIIQRLAVVPEWQREVRIDHIYKDVFLRFCRVAGFPTLEDVVANGKERAFSSIEQVAALSKFFRCKKSDKSVGALWQKQVRG